MPRKKELESKVQERIIKKYEAQGYLVVKLILTNKGGFPDLMLLKDGKAEFVEVKRKGDHPRPLQQYRVDELVKLGFSARVEDEA